MVISLKWRNRAMVMSGSLLRRLLPSGFVDLPDREHT